MTDIYTKLAEDHREAKNLLAQLAETGAVDPAKRASLFPALKKELTLHAKAEEVTFYRAIQDHKKTDDEVKDGKEEHDQMEKLLGELSDLDMDQGLWGEKIMELQQLVNHHVHDEEGDMYRHAKKILSDQQARELGVAFDREKARLAGGL